eukprot:6633856-Pyramimonas_sp.AAC.1
MSPAKRSIGTASDGMRGACGGEQMWPKLSKKLSKYVSHASRHGGRADHMISRHSASHWDVEIAGV